MVYIQQIHMNYYLLWEKIFLQVLKLLVLMSCIKTMERERLQQVVLLHHGYVQILGRQFLLHYTTCCCRPSVVWEGLSPILPFEVLIKFVHATLSTPHCPRQTMHATLCTPHCLRHTVYATLSTPNYACHTVNATLSTPHCPRQTMHASLSTPHCAHSPFTHISMAKEHTDNFTILSAELGKSGRSLLIPDANSWMFSWYRHMLTSWSRRVSGSTWRGRSSQSLEKPMAILVSCRNSWCASFKFMKMWRFCFFSFLLAPLRVMQSFRPGHMRLM